MELNKLRVNDLKAELASRNLDTKGVKAILVERLREAIERENADGSVKSTLVTAKKNEINIPSQSTPVRRSRRRSMTRSPSPVKTVVHTLVDNVGEIANHEGSTESHEPSSTRKKRRTRSITKSPSPVNSGFKHAPAKLDVLLEEVEMKTSVYMTEDSEEPSKTTHTDVTMMKQSLAANPPENEPSLVETEEVQAALRAKNMSCEKTNDDTRSITKSPSPVNSGFKHASAKLDVLLEEVEMKTSVYMIEDSEEPSKTTHTDVTMMKQSVAANPPVNEASLAETEDFQAGLRAQNVSCEQTNDDTEKNELQDGASLSVEVFAPIDLVPSDREKKVSSDTDYKVSTEILVQTTITKETTDQTAGRSLPIETETPTAKKILRNKAALVPIDFAAEELEPDIDEDHFSLSWYDSHLNLEIDPEMLDNAKPISEGAFALVWAGARANLGVAQGKVVYEVLLSKYNETRQVTDEPVTPAFRIGWSTMSASLELGESPWSFAYDGDGKKGTDNQFTEYGIPYKVNDVVGVYLDLDCSPCKIEYTVNGACQGVAFEFEKKNLNGQALFPHVYSRNIAFKVNFGQLKQSMLNGKVGSNQYALNEEAAIETETSVKVTGTGSDQAKPDSITNNFSGVTAEGQPVQEPLTIKQDFIYIASSERENLEHGPRRPVSRKDCEVIFLVGLPASGKTFWVQNYIKNNPEKRYTILSVDSLLNQMKVQGNTRKPSNTNKWAKLIEQLSKDLSKLNEIAGKRRRNFILDQTNVFLSEQKRRLRVFGEYAARKAVVVVPSEEEYNRRFKLKQDSFGIEVPEGRINIMKANFFIPTLEQKWFTEIEFTELDEEKTYETVRKLNEIGKIAHPRGNSYHNQQKSRRGCGLQNQRWHRYQYQHGGYRAQRNNKMQQNFQHQNFRPGNGYGRRDSGHSSVTRYGNNDWTQGRYDNRFATRGYQNNQTRRYDGNRGDYRGHNSGYAWNQQNFHWSYGSQNNDTQQWYSWWQQEGSGDSGGIETQWSQYAQKHNYGNYQQSKFQDSGPSSKNK